MKRIATSVTSALAVPGTACALAAGGLGAGGRTLARRALQTADCKVRELRPDGLVRSVSFPGR